MTKTILYCCFIFNSLAFLAGAQDTARYTVYYDFTFITDTSAEAYALPVECMLFRVKDESRFCTSNLYLRDSTLMHFREKNPEPDLSNKKEVQEYIKSVQNRENRIQVRNQIKVIKNFQTGRFKSIVPFLTYPAQYLEESMALDWEITGEEDTIAGLTCTKAITDYGGRRYHAWFSPEVPINDGPYVFQGLPGLIVRVRDTKGWYDFTLTKVIAKKTTRYLATWLDEYSQQLDRVAYVDKLTEFKDNPKMPSGVRGLSGEAMLQIKNSYKARFDLLMEQY